MRRHMLAAVAALSLAACDDIATGPAGRGDAAPRGTFSGGVNQQGNSAPERGELERLRLDNRSQRPAPPPVPIGGAPSSGGGSTNAAAADLQTDPVTGRPVTP